MQMKTYELSVQTARAANTVDNLVIENTDNREENFHGIRFQGRIITDDAASAFCSGIVAILCIPNDQITIPSLSTEAIINDSNSFIVAIKPWMTLSVTASGTNQNRFGGVVDFDIAPKTSRTCMKGGKIVGQVFNNAASGNLITLTSMLSLFRTNT